MCRFVCWGLGVGVVGVLMLLEFGLFVYWGLVGGRGVEVLKISFYFINLLVRIWIFLHLQKKFFTIVDYCNGLRVFEV